MENRWPSELHQLPVMGVGSTGGFAGAALADGPGVVSEHAVSAVTTRARASKPVFCNNLLLHASNKLPLKKQIRAISRREENKSADYMKRAGLLRPFLSGLEVMPGSFSRRQMRGFDLCACMFQRTFT